MKREKVEREADRYKTDNMTSYQKLSNFWYYNKLKIFFSIAGLALIISMIFVTVTKENEDMHIFYITDKPVVYTEKVNRLKAFFENYAEDINGDGKVTVIIENLYIGTEIGAYSNNDAVKNKERIMTVLRAGDCMLMVADTVGMDYLYAGEALEDLSSIVETDDYGGKAWLMNSNESVMNELKLEDGDNLYMGLRVFDGTIAAISDKKVKDFEQAQRVFQKILQS